MKVKSESEATQSCPTLCSLPGSWVHGILQARVLEWVALSFSRGASRIRSPTRVSHIAGRRFTIWATGEVRKVRKPQEKSWELSEAVGSWGWRKKVVTKIQSISEAAGADTGLQQVIQKIQLKGLTKVTALSHPKALMEMHDETETIFLPASTTSILQPMGQETVSTFKSHYLRNAFCKIIALTDSDPLKDLGKAIWKLSGRDSPLHLSLRVFVTNEKRSK